MSDQTGSRPEDVASFWGLMEDFGFHDYVRQCDILYDGHYRVRFSMSKCEDFLCCIDTCIREEIVRYAGKRKKRNPLWAPSYFSYSPSYHARMNAISSMNCAFDASDACMTVVEDNNYPHYVVCYQIRNCMTGCKLESLGL